MIIEARLTYLKKVQVDPNNPDHDKYLGLVKSFDEKITVNGIITDILKLSDASSIRVLSGTEKDDRGNKVNVYKDEVVSQNGVYVVFWEDMGDHYRMRIEDYHDITVLKPIMRNYVAKNYGL